MKHACLLLFALGCSGANEEPVEPRPEKPEPTEPEPASSSEPGSDPLHDALVDTHKKAVETCFGGFGKGAPYSAVLTVADGTVSEAAVEPLSDGHGPLPSDCIAKTFRGASLPGASAEVRARFAVKGESCSVPACPETDLVCGFKRDIACSVVIDAR